MHLIRAIVTLALIPSSALMAQTQHSLDDRSNQRARRADSTLNVLYRQVEAKYRSDSVALRKVRAAEHAWLAFRDAQIDAAYPATDRQTAYGSAFPMCVAVLREELTKQRIAQLKAALTPTEGDVCSSG